MHSDPADRLTHLVAVVRRGHLLHQLFDGCGVLQHDRIITAAGGHADDVVRLVCVADSDRTELITDGRKHATSHAVIASRRRRRRSVASEQQRVQKHRLGVLRVTYTHERAGRWSVVMHALTPPGLRGCKNRPAPFPGRIS